MSIEKIALSFVDSLVPDKFSKAESMLSPKCIYSYGDEKLTGESIIQSFVNNHENAKGKLDTIEYIDGKILSTDQNVVTVTVQDKIIKNGFEHIYTDRLILTVEESLIAKIEYSPFPEERRKLKEFLSKVGVVL